MSPAGSMKCLVPLTGKPEQYTHSQEVHKTLLKHCGTKNNLSFLNLTYSLKFSALGSHLVGLLERPTPVQRNWLSLLSSQKMTIFKEGKLKYSAILSLTVFHPII
jgi:hypothetical protein